MIGALAGPPSAMDGNFRFGTREKIRRVFCQDARHVHCILSGDKVSKGKYYDSNMHDRNNLNLYVSLPPRITDPEMPGHGEPPSSLWRRYSEFELLRCYLEVTYPHIVIPPLPEKRVKIT